LDLHGIVGSKQKTEWNSPNPETMGAAYADVLLQDFVRRTNMVDEVQSHWRCKVLRGANPLLVRRKGDSLWLFSLGDVQGIVGLGWPALSVMKFGSQYWELDLGPLGRQLHPLVITNSYDYDAIAIEFQAPLQQVLGKSLDTVIGVEHGLVALAVTTPDSLFRVAAKQAFWEIDHKELKEFLVEFKGEDAPHDSLYRTLWKLISILLPEKSEEDLLIIMGKRMSCKEPNVDDLLCIDDVLDVMTKDDVEQIKLAKLKSTCKGESRRTYVGEHDKECVRVRGKVPKVSTNVKNKNSPLFGLKFPAEVPKGAWKQPQAKALLPPGATIWHGTAGAWHAHPDPTEKYGRVSKDWKIAGSHTAAMMYCVRECWRDWLKKNQLKLTDCPMKDLFEDASWKSAVEAGYGVHRSCASV
jgi:hypothetical protein